MPPEVQTEISSEYDVSVWQSSSTVHDGEKAMRMAEVDRKRAELRHRMEAASLARKAKKGFMTPERKKKLRLLLRRKAAEELKKEQERKAEERRWIIEDRCGEPEDLEWASKDDLKDICDYYFQRIMEIESDKWDIEKEITKKAFEIADLNGRVNDLRGKFVRPILKKVSKYENKFAKLQRKAAEFNFRNQLKLVKRHDFSLKSDAEDKKAHGDKKDHDKPNKQSQLESTTQLYEYSTYSMILSKSYCGWKTTWWGAHCQWYNLLSTFPESSSSNVCFNNNANDNTSVLRMIR